MSDLHGPYISQQGSWLGSYFHALITAISAWVGHMVINRHPSGTWPCKAGQEMPHHMESCTFSFITRLLPTKALTETALVA